jgi:hypothetical protein
MRATYHVVCDKLGGSIVKIGVCIAALAAAASNIAGSAPVPVSPGAAAVLAAEQHEADLRVIAARCGTPAFEHSFYKQSRAAVSAGLVVKNRDPVEVEKAITSLRRSPVVLVASTADCADQLRQLADLQKERSLLMKSSRRSAAK